KAVRTPDAQRPGHIPQQPRDLDVGVLPVGGHGPKLAPRPVGRKRACAEHRHAQDYRRERSTIMGKLDGKVVVVTGASRGIGADIARLFAEEGGKVICAARTLREGDHPLEGSLEHTVGQIKEAGGEATAVAVDISQPEECQKLIETARSTYGPV